MTDGSLTGAKIMVKKNKILIIAACIFLAVVILFLGTAFSKDTAPKSFSGRVEVTEVDVNSKVAGKIAELRVAEGENVKAGQVLAVLDSAELKAKEKQALAVLQAAKEQVKQASEAAGLAKDQSSAIINQAQAGLSIANSQYEKAKNGARKQEVLAAEALEAKAHSAYLLIEKSYQRIKELYLEGAISEQSADEAETKLQAAQDDWNAAKQQLSMAVEGARVEDVSAALSQTQVYEGKLSEAQAGAKQIDIRLAALQAAKAQVEQAKGAVEEVRAYLANCVITAPVTGIVTMLNSDAGEVITAGMPILTISKLDTAWVEVKIPEIGIFALKLGQKAEVIFSGLESKPIQGKITRISALPDFATKRATSEIGEKDIVSFGVKVVIPNPDLLIKPGMSAQVIFR
jgi:HlyD family secretion protein